jgi:hypothetical protein
MGRDERDTRNRWQGERRQPDDLPEFDDDLGPARSPLQELREQPFLGDDDDDSNLADYPAPHPAAQAIKPRRASRSAEGDLPLTGTALVATIAYFAIGGLALIVTGLLLSGFAGILLALVGLLSAACAGLAAWQVFVAGAR